MVSIDTFGGITQDLSCFERIMRALDFAETMAFVYTLPSLLEVYCAALLSPRF